MKKINLTLLFLIVSKSAFSYSVKESFESALKNMESIKRADAVISQSEELKTQARAAVLPTISGVGTYTTIDPPDTSGGRSPFLLTRQYLGAIRLNQPLIRGGSVSAYQLAKENILLSKFQKDSSEINLYQLVLNSYYTLASAQMDVKNVDELLGYSRERVKEIRERTSIGRSRKGELVEAEAQVHIAESQYGQALLNLKQAEENFLFFTRLKPTDLKLVAEVPKVKMPLSELISMAQRRPDIMVRTQEIKVAENRVSIAKGGHYPQLDLTSNYYLERTGILETSVWDVGVQLVIPLYQGGGVSAQVKEAVEGKRIAELNKSEAMRTAERDINISYHNLEQIQFQLKSLKEALTKAEQVYRLNKKDYQYGIVTNLDVLQSLNVFIETKRSFDGLVAIGHLNYKNLEALTGVLP